MASTADKTMEGQKPWPDQAAAAGESSGPWGPKLCVLLWYLKHNVTKAFCGRLENVMEVVSWLPQQKEFYYFIPQHSRLRNVLLVLCVLFGSIRRLKGKKGMNIVVWVGGHAVGRRQFFYSKSSLPTWLKLHKFLPDPSWRRSKTD